MMKTLHISIDDESWERLLRAAQECCTTPERLALEAIEQFIKRSDRRALYEQAMQVVGKYHSGRADISARHDEYLIDAYAPHASENDESAR